LAGTRRRPRWSAANRWPARSPSSSARAATSALVDDQFERLAKEVEAAPAAAGRDAPAMLAAGVTRDFDERWGHFDFVPPSRFVESVVASLR
jgi:hypothetical protein